MPHVVKSGKNKIAILAIIVLLVIGIMTIIGPHINGYSFEEYDSAKVNLKSSKKSSKSPSSLKS